jgi:hypothetical protein
MTVQPITLDISRHGTVIIDPNIASMAIPCANVDILNVDICNWIISIGGWTQITAYNIMLLVDAYLGLINLGYTVRMEDINGAIAYYLGFLDSGNMFTGCIFRRD